MPGFLKIYPDAAKATQALHRSDVLRSQGLSTPQARPTPQIATLEFDRIDGETGRALLAVDFDELLRPLTGLHGLQLSGAPLFDPLLRIRPRLPLLSCPSMRSVLDEPVPQGSALVHGDLHVGQWIRDSAGRVWIIDLDDLAIGLPESDLANFCAHLSTTGKQKDFAVKLTQICTLVCQSWADLDQTCSADAFACFLRFALVRRHLKLRQAGRPDFESQISDFLATEEYRIFPSGNAAYRG